MSPLPPILHLAAAAIGIWGALTLGPKVAPDLTSDQPPGVVESGERQVTGPGDPQSLLQSGPLSIALGQIEDQLGADEKVQSLLVRPGQVDVESTDSGGGVAVDEIASSAPYLIAYQVGQRRRDVRGVQDLRAATFLATPTGGVWTVLLAPRLRPPHRYKAAVPVGVVAFQVRVRPVAGS